jgi:hypothetical protein
MTKRTDITPEIVAQSLEYNPNTGLFIWRTRPRHHFVDSRTMNSWNARYSNTEAGKRRKKDGRLTIFIMGIPFLANRLAYVIMMGVWPTYEVDHYNNDPTDDRWDNLRHATHAQNGRNQKRPKNNTTGYKGVVKRKYNGRYQASIGVGNKRIILGTFDTAEQAHEAYCKAAAELHGEFARTS